MTLQNYNTLLVLFQTFLAPLTGLPVEELWSQVVADCGDKLWTVVCCVFWPANACLCMLSHDRKQWKMLENYKKVLFSSYARETHARTWRKMQFFSIQVWLPNTGWHSKAGCSSAIKCKFSHFLYVSLSYAWSKTMI